MYVRYFLKWFVLNKFEIAKWFIRKISLNVVNGFFYFAINIPWLRTWSIIWTTFNFSLPKDAYCYVRLILDEWFRRREQKCVWKVYRLANLLTKDEHMVGKPHLKSLDPIHHRIYGNGENNRFDSFVYTNKQYINFFSNHTNIKLIKKSKTKNMSTVNRKYWVIPCFRTSDIHRRTDRLGQ